MQSVVAKDLVLVGGGHSHVAVLRSFGMRPIGGLRITLVSRDSLTPYSGMLPGVIAGAYTEAQAHIDLVPLCRFARARFIKGEAVGVDLQAKRIMFADRPSLQFDVLSLNCGSTPAIGSIRHSGGELICVKPIDRFLGQWHALLERLAAGAPMRKLVVVGGGAGGVELLLAIERRLCQLGYAPRCTVITDELDILLSHNRRIRTLLRRTLAARDIDVMIGTRVVERTAEGVQTDRGIDVPADEVFFVTHAAAAPWIRDSGLDVDANGFALVDEHLRSVSHHDVFAAGDIAAMRSHPRPKSGVFAVRQGKPLARNLRRAVLEQPLRRYRPQRHFLSLLGTADRHAVASRGAWAVQGGWLWTLKDWIDRRFMERYRKLPRMDDDLQAPVPSVLLHHLPSEAHDDGMRCGGCGAKLGATALTQALQGLQTISRSDVVVGLDQPDDAALISIPSNKLAVVSIDAFRPLVDDPYLFGQIAANHCLNDLYAVGAEPQSALAIATLPVWPEEKLVDELSQMLKGAVKVFTAEGAQLVGGHTGEGAELSLGFSVTGLVESSQVLGKRGVRSGDKLILTKPLGTGAIFAANMRAQAQGTWVDAAIATMLQSNRAASDCLRQYGARACTDVTGFGLAGHLVEMLAGGSIELLLDVNAVPLLEGAENCVANGWTSTLHQKNVSAVRGLRVGDALRARSSYQLLFDPQTAGGLLASVPAQRADDCVIELRRLGYSAAAVIGSAGAGSSVKPVISVS